MGRSKSRPEALVPSASCPKATTSQCTQMELLVLSVRALGKIIRLIGLATLLGHAAAETPARFDHMHSVISAGRRVTSEFGLAVL